MQRIYDLRVKSDDVLEITFFTGEIKELSRQRLLAYGEKYLALIDNNELYKDARIASDHNSLEWGEDNEYSITSNAVYSISDQIDKKYIDDIKVQLALSLVNIRKECKLSQKELERLTGINQSDISKYERAEGNPSLDTIVRIARSMDYSAKVEFTPSKDAEDLENISHDNAVDADRLVFFDDSDMCTREAIMRRSAGVRAELIHGKLRMCRDLNRQERRILSYLYMKFYEHNEALSGKLRVLTGPVGIMDNGPAFDGNAVSQNVELEEAGKIYDKREKSRRRGLASTKRIRTNGQRYDYENYFESQIVICSDDELVDNLYMKRIPEFVLDITCRETSDIDIDYKAGIYNRLGVSEYWLLDVDRKRIHAYRFHKGRNYRRDNAAYRLWNDPQNLLHDKEIQSYFDRIRPDNHKLNIQDRDTSVKQHIRHDLYDFYSTIELNVFGDLFKIDLQELIKFLDKKYIHDNRHGI